MQVVAVPLYLFLCLLLGGSSQSAWPGSLSYLPGLVLIAWAAVTARREKLERPARSLLALAIAALVLILLQLLPLPPGVWGSLPGRDQIAEGYRALGSGTPWLPLSVAPFRTVESAYALIPPIGTAAGILALRGHSDRAIAAAVILGALASVLLAALQIGSSDAQGFPYLYEVTSIGATGFFANRNHMATLLLAAIPFSAALFASAHPQVRRRGMAFVLLAATAASFVLILVGLALNRSLAALLLALPVTGFSLLILPLGWRFRRLVGPLAAIGFVAAVALLANSSIRAELVATPDAGSIFSRGHIWPVALRAAASAFPFGTGLGTFRPVYVLSENPAEVYPTFVNHAHNDYIELALELGLPGLLLLIAFLGWYAVQSVRVWRSPFSSLFAKAASIASAAVLTHSIVDYPLRTAAIAALFGACLALMADAGRMGRSKEARHVRIA